MQHSNSQPTKRHAYVNFKQKTYALTKHGKVMFTERLQQLGRMRAELLEQIRALKEQQADEPFDIAAKLTEARLIDNEMYRLDAILARSEAISLPKRDTIDIGSHVKLHSQEGELDLTLVNSVEADPSHGFISCESPIGRLLLGRHLQETVKLETPRTKSKTYRIVGIEHDTALDADARQPDDQPA